MRAALRAWVRWPLTVRVPGCLGALPVAAALGAERTVIAHDFRAQEDGVHDDLWINRWTE